MAAEPEDGGALLERVARTLERQRARRIKAELRADIAADIESDLVFVLVRHWGTLPTTFRSELQPVLERMVPELEVRPDGRRVVGES